MQTPWPWQVPSIQLQSDPQLFVMLPQLPQGAFIVWPGVQAEELRQLVGMQPPFAQLSVEAHEPHAWPASPQPCADWLEVARQPPSGSQQPSQVGGLGHMAPHIEGTFAPQTPGQLQPPSRPPLLPPEVPPPEVEPPEVEPPEVEPPEVEPPEVEPPEVEPPEVEPPEVEPPEVEPPEVELPPLAPPPPSEAGSGRQARPSQNVPAGQPSPHGRSQSSSLPQTRFEGQLPPSAQERIPAPTEG